MTREENYKMKAYKCIIEMIQSGEIRPGDTISEQSIGEKLGISRTPIREAFNILAQDGIVELSPNRGASLKVPTFKEIWEIYQIREALEPLAATLCIDNFGGDDLEYYRRSLAEYRVHPSPELLQICDEFHDKVIQLCGNEQLVNILKRLRLVIRRLQVFSEKQPGRIQRSLMEHEAILTAIANRNGAEAGLRMREHIVSMRDSTLNLLNSPN